MNSRRILNTIISVLVLVLFFRFIGLMIVYWYISVPIILAIYFYMRKKIQIFKSQIFGGTNQQAKPDEDETIIDAEYTVVDDEE